MNDETITSLLGEIRDNQRQALDQQRTQLDIARSHLEQAKAQIAENRWHNNAGNEFSDYYKMLARGFQRDGQAGVDAVAPDRRSRRPA